MEWNASKVEAGKWVKIDAEVRSSPSSSLLFFFWDSFVFILLPTFSSPLDIFPFLLSVVYLLLFCSVSLSPRLHLTRQERRRRLVLYTTQVERHLFASCSSSFGPSLLFSLSLFFSLVQRKRQESSCLETASILSSALSKCLSCWSWSKSLFPFTCSWREKTSVKCLQKRR